MKRLLCLIGIHDWRITPGTKKFGWMIKCKRCEKVIFGDYNN